MSAYVSLPGCLHPHNAVQLINSSSCYDICDYYECMKQSPLSVAATVHFFKLPPRAGWLSTLKETDMTCLQTSYLKGTAGTTVHVATRHITGHLHEMLITPHIRKSGNTRTPVCHYLSFLGMTRNIMFIIHLARI